MPPSSLRVPTPDELRDLLRLCGTAELVIAYLAKSLALPADSIADDVRSWLAELPDIPPPSRQRSAPAAPVQTQMTRLASASKGSSNRGPEILRVRTPPKSAPVRPLSAELMKEMARLNLSINSKFAAANSTLAKQRMPLRAVQRADVQMGNHSFHPSTLMPQVIPEDSHLVVDYTKEDDALKAYVARSNLMHNGLAVKVSAATGSHGTRMRY